MKTNSKSKLVAKACRLYLVIALVLFPLLASEKTFAEDVPGTLAQTGTGLTAFTIDPSVTSTFQLDLNVTPSFNSFGLSYWLQSNDGSGFFSVIARSVTGSPYTDLTTSDAEAFTAAAGLLDPVNNRDLGGFTPSAPVGPGTHFVAKLTFSIGAIPPGTYHIFLSTQSPKSSIVTDDGFGENPIVANAVTITIASNASPIATNTNDSGAGSLRQALLDAQDGDTITFAIPPVAPDAPATVTVITLTSGELAVNNNITISGPGADMLRIERDILASPFRIFHVNPGHTVTIEGLSISNGDADTSSGGGILNDQSTLTVNSCAVSGNSAADSGGGAIANLGSATLTVLNSTLSNNSAADGGAIWNNANGGSAILTVTNSTLSGNAATGAGGAVYNLNGQMTVSNSTLSGNSGPQGNITNFDTSFGAQLDIGNTILKAGATGDNIVNLGGTVTVTSQGYNLSDDNGGGFLTGTGDQINTDPILSPLKDNGGPTFTHAPLSNSPAIDQGKDIGATGVDQRGSLRPVTYLAAITPPAGGDRTDIGALELPPGVQPSNAASHKMHGGAGDKAIDLPLTGTPGTECRSGGGTNDYQVILNFVGPVSFSSPAVVTSGSGSVVSSTGDGTNQITLNLTGVTNAQIITLALFDANDGANSGDVGLRMGVLVGDTTGSGDVNASDVSDVKFESGELVSESNFRADVTANGAITSTDVSLVKSKSGTALP